MAFGASDSRVILLTTGADMCVSTVLARALAGVPIVAYDTCGRGGLDRAIGVPSRLAGSGRGGLTNEHIHTHPIFYSPRDGIVLAIEDSRGHERVVVPANRVECVYDRPVPQSYSIVRQSLMEAERHGGVSIVANCLTVYLKTAQQLNEIGDLRNVFVFGLISLMSSGVRLVGSLMDSRLAEASFQVCYLVLKPSDVTGLGSLAGGRRSLHQNRWLNGAGGLGGG